MVTKTQINKARAVLMRAKKRMAKAMRDKNRTGLRAADQAQMIALRHLWDLEARYTLEQQRKKR